MFNELEFVKPPKGLCPKHMVLGMSTATMRPILDYILDRAMEFTREQIRVRPLDEMKKIAADYYDNLGLELPSSEWASVLYCGDGKHYPIWKPDNESRRPSDSEMATHKQGTRGQTCLAHLAFWDLSGLCIGVCPAVWCGLVKVFSTEDF